MRAVLEAAAFALRHVAAPAVAAGLPFRELRVTGGTAASRLWNQVKADVVGVEVAVPRVAEASVAGAAILAAVGIGLVPDARAGIDALVRVAERLAPDPAARAVYDRLAPEYEELHARLAPVNAVLAEVEERPRGRDSRQPLDRRSRILALTGTAPAPGRPSRRPRPCSTGGSPVLNPRPSSPIRAGRVVALLVVAAMSAAACVPGAASEASPTPTLAPTPTPSANPYDGVAEGAGAGVKLGYLSYGELVPFVAADLEGDPGPGDPRRRGARGVRRARWTRSGSRTA